MTSTPKEAKRKTFKSHTLDTWSMTRVGFAAICLRCDALGAQFFTSINKNDGTFVCIFVYVFLLSVFLFYRTHVSSTTKSFRTVNVTRNIILAGNLLQSRKLKLKNISVCYFIVLPVCEHLLEQTTGHLKQKNWEVVCILISTKKAKKTGRVS